MHIRYGLTGCIHTFSSHVDIILITTAYCHTQPAMSAGHNVMSAGHNVIRASFHISISRTVQLETFV